jgi:hypothetical protein
MVHSKNYHRPMNHKRFGAQISLYPSGNVGRTIHPRNTDHLSRGMRAPWFAAAAVGTLALVTLPTPDRRACGGTDIEETTVTGGSLGVVCVIQRGNSGLTGRN